MEWELVNQRKRREAKQHEKFRKELWIGVAIAVARSDETKEKTSPGRWADAALREFDRTFI